MDLLFQVETERLSLRWSLARATAKPRLVAPNSAGWLKLTPRRAGVSFLPQTSRASVPSAPSVDQATLTSGPLLFEQTDYALFARAKGNHRLELIHRDPALLGNLRSEDEDALLHGLINFGSQIGRSTFTVRIDGEPELDLELEVFPSKLDYRTDYEQLLAEVQEILTGLALEYLRSTYRSGASASSPQPTQLEWLTLLRHVIDDLERGLRQVARAPIRGLHRTALPTRAERIKRVDSRVRAAIRRGAGRGERVDLGAGLSVREHLDEHRARPTLDTPEHRWLAAQVGRIRSRLASLIAEERRREPNPRQLRVLAELTSMEGRLARLEGLEPLAEAQAPPPPGFASLQLQAAPGYREASRACLVLLLGLRLEGGPLKLSVKDLSLLYEYWCYLAVLRLVSEETGEPVDPKAVVEVSRAGLSVLLERGRESSVRFDAAGGRSVLVRYNPSFRHDVLFEQRPDVLITLENRDWPLAHLVLDAKYRIDLSEKYRESHGAPGPPQDAINVLHRYRDAMLERPSRAALGGRSTRAVVEGAALYPYREAENQAGEYARSRLASSLERVGIGAIPALPGSVSHLRAWLRKMLHEGGWALSDRAPGHALPEAAARYRRSAEEWVQVIWVPQGGGEPALDEVDLPWDPADGRSLQCRYLAWARALPRGGAEWVAARAVRAVVPAPAPAGGPVAALRYQLGPRLSGQGAPVRTGPLRYAPADTGPAFTTRLAAERAVRVEELWLWAEAEWRLAEALQARQIPFSVASATSAKSSPIEPWGAAEVVLGSGERLRYLGAGGFLVQGGASPDRTAMNVPALLRLLFDPSAMPGPTSS